MKSFLDALKFSLLLSVFFAMGWFTRDLQNESSDTDPLQPYKDSVAYYDSVATSYAYTIDTLFIQYKESVKRIDSIQILLDNIEITHEKNLDDFITWDLDKHIRFFSDQTSGN
jgi:hypothetical protein